MNAEEAYAHMNDDDKRVVSVLMQVGYEFVDAVQLTLTDNTILDDYSEEVK